MFALCVMTFPLAFFSWRYVERPFRRKQEVGGKMLIITGALVASGFVAFGLAGHFSEGFPGRFSPEVQRLMAYRDDDNPMRDKCSSHIGRYLAPEAACKLGDSGPVVGALLGDSHSDSFAYPLHEMLSEAGVQLKHMWYSGCPPIPGLYRVDQSAAHKCDSYNCDVFDELMLRKHEVVVLSSRFTQYYQKTPYDNLEGGIEPQNAFVDLEKFAGQKRNEKARKSNVLAAYVTGVSQYLDRGKKVILVYPIPEQGWDVPLVAAQRLAYHGNGEVSVSLDSYRERNKPVVDAFDAIPDHENLFRVRPADIFCDTFIPGRCVGALDGKSFYRDDDHLSNYGGSFIAREIVEIIQRSQAAK